MALASQLKGCKVLVVEDEYLIAWDISNTLEAAGATVIGPSGRLSDALDLLETHDDITAAVLDIRLHGVLVFPIADILEARGIPFVFTSGCDSREIPKGYRKAAHCQKPVGPAELLRTLAEQMALRTAA